MTLISTLEIIRLQDEYRLVLNSLLYSRKMKNSIGGGIIMLKKWIAMPIILILISGCNNGNDEAYNKFFQDGLDYVAAEDFIRAEIQLERALESRPNDPKSMNLLDQVQLYQKAVDYYSLEQFDKSLEELERVIEVEDGSIGMITKAQNFIERIHMILDEKTAQAEKEDEIESEDRSDFDEEVDNQSEEKSDEKLTVNRENQSNNDENHSESATEESAVVADNSNPIEELTKTADYTFEDFQGAYVMFESVPFESRLYYIIEIFESKIHQGWFESEYYVTLIDSYWIEENTLFVNGTSLDFEGSPESTDIYEYSIRENERLELFFSQTDVTMFKVTDYELEVMLYGGAVSY